MIPPGLLPDSSEPRRSSPPWVLAAVVCAALVALLGAALQIRRLVRERDHAVEQLEGMVRKGPTETAPRPVETSKPGAEAPSPVPPPAPPPPPPRAPD